MALQAHVYRLAGRLQTQPELAPRDGLAQATRRFWAAGVLNALLLPIFFVNTGDEVKLTITLLVAWIAAPTLHSASGVFAAYLGVTLFPGLVLAAGWLARGGVLGWGLAFLCTVFLWPAAYVALRQQRGSWEQLVRLVDANETLAASLTIERDRAEAASEARTRFFAAASHDLRQPLHAPAINATTLELVAKRSGDRLLADLSDGITRALQQSRGLLDSLLDISRLDAHAVKAQLAAQDLAILLGNVRDEFHGLAAQRGLTIALDVAEPAPWAQTDADQLARILANLVDNAIKFTREGGITLSAAHDGPGRVLVRVSDTGRASRRPSANGCSKSSIRSATRRATGPKGSASAWRSCAAPRR